MSWSDQVFRYCERGADPGFWAEPVNALSNAAFLLAAIAAVVVMARQPGGGKGRWPEQVLIALVFVIGIGSSSPSRLASAVATARIAEESRPPASGIGDDVINSLKDRGAKVQVRPNTWAAPAAFLSGSPAAAAGLPQNSQARRCSR